MAALEPGRTSWTALLDAIRLAPGGSPNQHRAPRHDVGRIGATGVPYARPNHHMKGDPLTLIRSQAPTQHLTKHALRPPFSARGDYRTRVDDAVRGGSTIARADLADAVLRVLPDSGTHRHTVDVAY
ncbi:hypothetical protein [Streptosporangium roseum]|uniref:hypothetical protein n=1 Tax=Streptosporangium roseum TaxID=2001 RepID=UPI0004CDC25E|nr:hypothetical protein [Streptosporangium roseum]